MIQPCKSDAKGLLKVAMKIKKGVRLESKEEMELAIKYGFVRPSLEKNPILVKQLEDEGIAWKELVEFAEQFY